MKRTHCIALAVVALSVLAAVPDVQAQTKKISYAITDLGPWVSSNSSNASGINNSGQINGTSYIDGTTRHACTWERSGEQWVVQDLGAPQDCTESVGLGINELGEAVGWASMSDGHKKACFFGENGLIELVPGEYESSYAMEVNDLGDVAGHANNVYPLGQACLWQRETDSTWTFTDLGTLSGCYQSQARGLNNFNQVVGYSWADAGGSSRACFWERNEEGQWILEYPGGANRSIAYCINNAGQIVGHQYINDTTYHAYLWERMNGHWTATDLQAVAPPGVSKSFAFDINELGQVVGQALPAAGGGRGYLYEDGVMYDLNSFLPIGSGWSLALATAINEQGEIVGSGTSPAGYSHAFLMDTRAVTYSYTSTGSAVRIKDKAVASKAMTLTDNATITDLNVQVTLYHTRYADLKFELVGPDSVTARTLCNAGAVTGSGTKTLVFDDEGAAGTIKADALSNYDGKSTQGTWTLKITDTLKNYKTGSFTSFTLDVVPL